MSDSFYALPAGSVLNQYEIVRVLGSGGFGITYLARDSALDSLVAIKEYLPSDFAVRGGDSRVSAKSGAMDENFGWGRARFLYEARVLAKFRHPNIVRVFQVFEQNNTAYIVMEYVEGTPLSELIDTRGGLEESEVKAILLPLLDGLKRIHQRGFLHRDIKPSNIILRTGEGPVLIDFGAARQAVETRSRSITSIVTEGYAPLEQYDPAGNQGPWTDVHALGAVAYKCLTGKTPAAAPARVRNDPLVPLETAAKHHLSKEFAAAIRSALSVYEEDRPQTMEEFERAILGQAAPAASAASDNTVLIGGDATQKLQAIPAGQKPRAVYQAPRDMSVATDQRADIFISYSQHDREWVQTFATALEAEGFIVWWDPFILPGLKYREAISDRLAAAKIVVVVWSAAAAKSDYVRDEAEEGRLAGKLVPVQCETVVLPHGFRQLQTADLSHWRGDPSSPQFRLLISGINALVGRSVTITTKDISRKKVGGWRSIQGFADSTAAKFAAAAFSAVIILGGFWWLNSGASAEDRRAWSRANAADTIPAYQGYLREEADGKHAPEARERMRTLRDETERSWAAAEREDTAATYQNFLNQYGKDGLHDSEAMAALQRLRSPTGSQQQQSLARIPPQATPPGPQPDSRGSRNDQNTSSPSSEDKLSSDPAPTFDCTRTAYADERLICQNNALAALDRRMNEAYHALRARQPDRRVPSDALSYARQALVERHNCGSDVGCITSVLLAEKNYYERYGAQD